METKQEHNYWYGGASYAHPFHFEGIFRDVAIEVLHESDRKPPRPKPKPQPITGYDISNEHYFKLWSNRRQN